MQRDANLRARGLELRRRLRRLRRRAARASSSFWRLAAASAFAAFDLLLFSLWRRKVSSRSLASSSVRAETRRVRRTIDERPARTLSRAATSIPNSAGSDNCFVRVGVRPPAPFPQG